MALAAGTQLDGYEILAPLGSGGMGDVYRALDPVLKREVAIKVLPTSVARDADRLRRFEQEAQAAAALNHPNILAIYRFGVFEGAPYLVSELLEGSTLRHVEERGPLPVRKAIDIGVQIANGLAAAHEKGIVHRDLKPENLFVTKDGRVKILDFGLAKLTQPAPSSSSDAPTQAAGAAPNTEPGMVLGTVGYMAPEQVRGLPSDHRADIFAFGAVLYEMLSGKRAFHRSTSADTMAAILNEDPPSISQTSQTTPPALQRVVQRCLEKNPEQRFQSASDLSFALEALSQSGSSPSVAVAIPKQRKPLRALGWSVGFVVLVAVAAGSYFLLRPKKKIPFEHYSIQKAIDNKHVSHLAISPDGNYLAMVVRGADGAQNLVLHHIPTNSERPILQDPTYKYGSLMFSPDGNYIYFQINVWQTSPDHNADQYMLPVLGGQPVRILEKVDSPISFIDQNRRICFQRGEKIHETYKVLSANADGGDEKVLAEYKVPFPTLFACDPDGKGAVAFEYRVGWEHLDFSVSSKRKLLSTTSLAYDGIQRSPEGDSFYVVTHVKSGSPGQISLLSTTAGTIRQITQDLSSYDELSLTSDGRTLAARTVERNSRFAEYSLQSSRLEEHPVDDLAWFAWLDDGQIIESTLNDDLKILDLRTNQATPAASKSEAAYFHASPCGKDALVVSGALQGESAYHVYMLFLNGRKPVQLTNGQVDFFPQCSPDGRWLYYADNSDSSKPYLMRQPLSGGPVQRVSEANVWFDLSRDGRFIAVTVDDHVTQGHLQILSADSLQVLKSFQLPEDWAGDYGIIAFSANSDSIFYQNRTGRDSTIWRQPLDKVSRVKVGTLSGRSVYWIRPSPDGKRLGLSLGVPTTEAVLLHDDR